jgi:hypothetical protein
MCCSKVIGARGTHAVAMQRDAPLPLMAEAAVA